MDTASKPQEGFAKPFSLPTKEEVDTLQSKKFAKGCPFTMDDIQTIHAAIASPLTLNLSPPSKERYAIFMCGPSGSGKSTLLKTVVAEKGMATYIHASPDISLAALPWDQSKKETCRTVNTAILTDLLVPRYFASHHHIVLDFTCRDSNTLQRMLLKANAEGYITVLVEVYVSLETSKFRVKAREKYTGRAIPEDVVERIYQEFAEKAESYTQSSLYPFDEIILYNNNEEENVATLLLRYQRLNPSGAFAQKGQFYFDIEKIIGAKVSSSSLSSAAPVQLKGSEVYKLHTANPNTKLSRGLLQTYFETFDYPFTRHHIDSYDQFLQQDLPSILRANNPLLLVKEQNPVTQVYKYKAEIFVGGLTGDAIEIGAPTLTLKQGEEVRLLFPNEARLRNLTYASTVYADIVIRVTIDSGLSGVASATEPFLQEYKRVPLFQLPICLHSRFCILHGKPASFLQEAGECPQDQGGYYIVDGTEKILVTRQEQAFNTLYVSPQQSDMQVETYASITCLSPITRETKVVTFCWMRATDSLHVTLPMVRVPIPVFVLFRALGYTSDEEILRLLYPNLETSEAKQMVPLLLPSLREAFPFMDQFSAIQFIKAMTKGFSEAHVYDILFNKLFIHIPDARSGSRAHFLAECVRRFMRVHTGIDPKTDRDDMRNQRCLTAGVLIRMLFNQAYGNWLKVSRLAISKVYEYNKSEYQESNFINIFSPGNLESLFLNIKMDQNEYFSLTNEIMRGFKGKWAVGGSGGDEKAGVLQALSRLSYLDFMSHCRRAHMNFDTGMKLTGPRHLHGSQYGYFCTNEVPGGSSIGITKNLSMLTMITTSTNPQSFIHFLLSRSWVIPCAEMRNDLLQLAVPVFVNNGIVGYTLQPQELTDVLKLMKWTACLPAMASVGFSVRNRFVFVYLDEGRPCRPLIHLPSSGGKAILTESHKASLQGITNWRNAICGTFPETAQRGISTSGFFDPFAEVEGHLSLRKYADALRPYAGMIEYVDPYEQNEAFVINFPEHLVPEASHMEIHPSTIVSIVNSMIPFANFNQSVRNQLSCAQSKQGVSMYATNFMNRFDNSAHVLSYGEAPLVRTQLYDVLGEGSMPYGQNVVMAIMPFHGYNRDDGIIFNEDAFQRGLFRNITYRSYSAFEEHDKRAGTTTHIGNPLTIPQWTSLRPGLDYSKLDERGIIKIGELVDENTVLVSMYLEDKATQYKDASITPQVWTSGRVESVNITVNNLGFRMVKVRITQDRVPELGDKFSTRHGQKGTIGMLYRAHDMPRTASGVVPDMIVNPHCIPSRMTIGQLMEMLFGKVCYTNTMVGDATLFTSDKDAPEAIGRVLEQYGMEKTGNEIMYDGETGTQMPTNIFVGPLFAMRLKHMVEDKWNARAEGRREQRTRQPTGGRGNQGGLRIGEMDRDTLVGHGISDFLRESMMERSDKTQIRICNGCGTVPIYNDKQNLLVCPLCDGPVRHIGNNAQNLEILPNVERSQVTSSVVEIPYATKLLAEELETYLNMGLRFITGKGVLGLKEPEGMEKVRGSAVQDALKRELPDIIFPETHTPEIVEKPAKTFEPEDLIAMGVVPGALGSDGQVMNEEEEEEFTIEDAKEEEREAQEEASRFAAAAAEMAPTQMQGGFAYAQPAPAYAAPTPPAAYAAQQQFLMPPSMTPPSYSMPMQSQQMAPIQYQQPQQQQQQQQQQHAQIGGYAQQYMIPAPIVYQPPFSQPQQQNVPPTIVVDTSPQAMVTGGYMEDEHAAIRGIPVMGRSQSNQRHHTTPRNRAASPKPTRASMTFGGAPFSSSTKITINKLG
jgi:DNA-directed RNA polymerase II subunit RPB2